MNFSMKLLLLAFLNPICAIPTGAKDSVHSVSRESGKVFNCNCGYSNVGEFVTVFTTSLHVVGD